MPATSRQKALLDILQQGLVLSQMKNRQKELGDRTSYIGLTDIIKYSECPRSAIAHKSGQESPSLQNLLARQRGHWFEDGLADVFASLGANQLRQLEISVFFAGSDLKAHLDFTLVWGNPMQPVRILELKTCEKIPAEAMPSHEMQITGQVSLLHEYWNKPVFNLRDNQGKLVCKEMTFPKLCKLCFNITLPADPDEIAIEGWLLYLSMKNARPFGPYLVSQNTLDLISSLADEFSINKNLCASHPDYQDTLNYARGFSMLCFNCPASEGCPKFRDAANLPQWEYAIIKLEKFKAEKATLDTQIGEIEKALKQAHALSGTQGWLNTGSHRFKVATMSGRKTLDLPGLKSELAEIFCSFGRDIVDDIDIDALFARHESRGAPYSRLTINKI